MLRKIQSVLFGRLRSAYYQQRYLDYKKRYSITSNFHFNGEDIKIYGNGEIKVGENSYIGSYSTLQLKEGYKIVIGDNCRISHNVRMYTASADPDLDFTLSSKSPPKSGDITIHDGAWIGANVFINPGVTIGRNSVVGANSVVTKDVAENAIVGGVPARLIRFKRK